MKKLLGASAITVTLLALAACGGNDEDAAMPDVAGSSLDLALSDLDRAGYDPDDVEIVGGGVFGVVDESNWEVCDQEPPAGEPMGSAPRLTVDRSCGGTSTGTDATGTGEDSPPTDENPAAAGDGGDSFVMPSLVGMNLQAAQDQLQSLGSYVLTQTDATGAGRFQVLDRNWKVCFQVPAPGTTTPLSKLIELGAVKLEESCS
ncbi:hypothetical protein [Pimelobacter simplex]|uniref:hypothetical protein n=1 Tax=Nocardioides simplex TaxID=2045 RepID=UPI003AB046A7